EVPGPLPQDPPGADQPPAGSGVQPASDSTTAASTTSTAGSMTGSADKQAPVVSGFKTSNKTFAVGRARTAIAALARGTKLRYTLSEAAKVMIKIQRVSTHNFGGKLTRRGVKGANTVKF